MSSFNFRLIAQALLEKQIDTFPHINQNRLAFELQDNYQSRAHTNPREYGFEFCNFTAKQKEFIYSISDALMDLCIERFGSYEDKVEVEDKDEE
jgi:hypothetical protein